MSDSIGVSDVNTGTMALLDVRHRHGHEQIRGALRYNHAALMGLSKAVLPLPHEGPIVVYADSDGDAKAAAQHLRDLGYAEAVTLQGGYEAWKTAGLPVEATTQEQPIASDESTGIERV